MMKLKELFEDLHEAFYAKLYEMAFSRRDAESKITSLAHSLVEHLIKITKWKDEQNFQKHCIDINGWLRQIRIIKLKGNKLPKVEDYYRWMYLDIVPDFDTLQLWIEGLTNYHNLKSIRSDAEVYELLSQIMSDVSFDLSKNIRKNISSYLLTEQKYDI